jgi:VCBS repeat-containing protein
VIIDDVNNLALEPQLVAAGCETSNGTITINASGGKEPYSYSLDGGAAQAEEVFPGLSVGDYTALVMDDDGCESSVTVTVLSGVSYNDQILPIINTNCAKSGCHDGSNSSIPNWTNLTTVQTNAANIKTRTANGSMPPAGNDALEPAEVQAIACWVDDGALAN